MFALLLIALALVEFKEHYDEYVFGKGNSLNDILSKTEQLSKDIIIMIDKLDEINSKLDIILGGYGARKSYHAACYIIGDFNGSCIVTNIRGSYYAVTNRHVIYDGQKNCTCIIKYITMADNSTLIFTSNITFFSTLDAPDLALIPLEVNSNQASNAVLVSNVTCQIRDKLFGTTFQQRKIRYSECNIVEDIHNETSYISDCPGFPVYSGTGYLNYYGELVAVHYGSAQTSYERKMQTNNYKKESNKAMTNIHYDCIDLKNNIINFIFNSTNLTYNYSKSCISNQDIDSIFSKFNKSSGESGLNINDTIYDLTDNLMNKIEDNIEYHARNPRTLIIPAYHLYELAYINKSSRVVSIKQGKSFNLTST